MQQHHRARLCLRLLIARADRTAPPTLLPLTPFLPLTPSPLLHCLASPARPPARAATIHLDLKSLRSQVESYLALNYEVALISLFITEAVGKAVGVLLPQKEKRKLYFSSLLSTYSVCRANSWMLLRANHSIDLGKTGSKLNVQVAAPVRAHMIKNNQTAVALRFAWCYWSSSSPSSSLPWTRLDSSLDST